MIQLKRLIEQRPKKIGSVITNFMDVPTTAGSMGNFKDLGFDIFDTMNGPQLNSTTANSSYEQHLSGFKFTPDYTIATKTFYGKPLKLTWLRLPQSFIVDYNNKDLGVFNTIRFEKWLSKF